MVVFKIGARHEGASRRGRAPNLAELPLACQRQLPPTRVLYSGRSLPPSHRSTSALGPALSTPIGRRSVNRGCVPPQPKVRAVEGMSSKRQPEAVRTLPTATPPCLIRRAGINTCAGVKSMGRMNLAIAVLAEPRTRPDRLAYPRSTTFPIVSTALRGFRRLESHDGNRSPIDSAGRTG